MVEDKVVYPHDHYFKLTMSDPKVAKEFFNRYLPANIRSSLNFETIVQQKESYISEALKKQEVDLLFQAEFNGKLGYLYLLLEHQVVPDKLMAFRILKYMVAIMEDHLKKNKKEVLPVVVPLVLYSGRRDYNYSTNLFDLFGEHKELAQDILWKPFKLIDLSKISDEELKSGCMYGIVARMLKHAHDKEITDFLKSILQELEAIEKYGSMRYIYATIAYVMSVYDISKEDLLKIIKSELPSVSEEKIMTIAEQYRQEGYQKGQFDGIEKGRMEALKMATVALNLLNKGMSIKEIAKTAGLSVAEVEQLKSQIGN